MNTLRLGNPATPERQRYDDLATNWDRIDLEHYAIALTRDKRPKGATKIRLVHTILQAEFGD